MRFKDMLLQLLLLNRKKNLARLCQEYKTVTVTSLDILSLLLSRLKILQEFKFNTYLDCQFGQKFGQKCQQRQTHIISKMLVFKKAKHFEKKIFQIILTPAPLLNKGHFFNFNGPRFYDSKYKNCWTHFGSHRAQNKHEHSSLFPLGGQQKIRYEPTVSWHEL